MQWPPSNCLQFCLIQLSREAITTYSARTVTVKDGGQDATVDDTRKCLVLVAQGYRCLGR